MRKGHWQSRVLWVATGFTLLLALSAGAQNNASSDTREINAYRLTAAALAKYTQAQKEMDVLARQAASDCGDEDEEGSGNGTTIDQLVTKLNATAGARAAIQSAGMTTREFVVFSMSVFQAGMADWALGQAGGKLPPGVAMENVTFYRKHQAEMQKLGESAKAAAKAADCDDE
jgi:hypothetical protein